MGFLALPAELRNVIYDMVLIKKDPIEIRHRHIFEIDYRYSRAITQANRQTRAECLSNYYMSNTFLLPSMFNCIAWLNKIGAERKNLRHVRLAEGVLDGAGWMTSRNDQHHRVKVSCRLLTPDGLDPKLSTLTAEDDVTDEMRAKAKAWMSAIKDAMKDRGPLDMEISGSVYHCTHCGFGSCMWCRNGRCCNRVWDDSD